MTDITLPDGTSLIDDGDLMPSNMARHMFSRGMTAEEIAADMKEPLSSINEWLSWGPYESPEDYWNRLYREGRHLQVLAGEDEDE
jgi:hypothetical protein